ncbi:MAG: MBL fold metallo-hydrolase [Clostridia bacterium]|nr:MBL fold metallo-hydrolase [Clostridia bacterium]
MRIKLIVTQPFGQNCYVVSDDENRAVIIDPGASEEKISLYLMQNALKPQAILLTHGHFDHVGAVNLLSKEYNLPVYANIYEKGILSNPSKIYVFGGGGEAVKVDNWFENGDVLEFGDLTFKALHTPGHTVGSSCFLLKDNLFSGDTLFRESIGRCDLEGGSFETILSSIKNKIYTLDDNTNVYPGHGDMTDVGFEKIYNPYVRGE